MKFSKDTPTAAFAIQGKSFFIPRPFGEGHQCSAGDANVLCQTLSENTRNAFNSRVKDAVDNETFDHNVMQAAIDEWLEDYEFGIRRGRGPVDPVEREKLNMAKDIVRQALRERDYKIADIAPEEITRLAEDVIKSNPDIAKEAKRRVDQRAKLTSSEVGQVQELAAE